MIHQENKKISIDKFEIDNLKCGGCANTIERTLLKMKGVDGVDVDVESGTVEVNHIGNISSEELMAKLTSIGYPAKDTSTLLQKGKSYISCAIGRVKK